MSAESHFSGVFPLETGYKITVPNDSPVL